MFAACLRSSNNKANSRARLGQGPTHSQNLQSWLTHIPGLKVYSPSNDAYHMMRKSVEDDNPVILIEHRWLHNQKGKLGKMENVVL